MTAPAPDVTPSGAADPNPPSYDTVVDPASSSSAPAPEKADASQIAEYHPPLPPRHPSSFPVTRPPDDDISDPTHYARDPHKLVGYLIPFPKPNIKGIDASRIPERFLIYTPPPPPLVKPAEGEKEGKLHKVQRKWQEEVREAKTSDAKLASWKGLKGRATKGINTAIGWTKTSNLEFLNRFPGSSDSKPASSTSTTTDASATADPSRAPSDTPPPGGKLGLEELVLVHPQAMPGNEQTIREEFVNTMLRTKSKAQRDAIIATGLLPVAYGVDILATLIWPFGGLGEIDTVWAYASLKGAKTARSVTKRLASSEGTDGQQANPEDPNSPKMKLTFRPSQRLDTLCKLLDGECHRRNRGRFASPGPEPTDSEAVDAIGWQPSQTNGNTKNWEDEQWELQEVKEDLRGVLHKGAREWDKWCSAFEKNPEKALKK